MISFTLNGKTVQASTDETLFDIAKREGTTLPHLCSGYHSYNKNDGNCRLCVVEVEGERTLSASCMRTVQDGMVVNTHSDKVVKSRKMVMELLLADQPERGECPDPTSHFWKMADEVGIENSRFPAKETVKSDYSHPALAVDLNACIHCTNCVRACQELQSNDVLGMAFRGGQSTISFDQNDTVDSSTCVACGECVQSCPTGALLPRDPMTGDAVTSSDEQVNSVCPFCGVGCQLTFHVKDGRLVKSEGRDGPANNEKLCVKGRFGFDYIHHDQRLTKPLIRRDDAPKEQMDPANPLTHFREATWEEALEKAVTGFKKYQPNELAGFGSAKGSNEEAYLFQKLIRTGFGTNNVDHCTRLCHASSVAALMEGLGSAAVSAPFMDALKADVIIVIGSRPAQNHPVAATYIKEAVKKGVTLIVMDPRKQNLTRYADHMLQFKSGADVALLNAMIHTIITENLIDEEFIAERTLDFDALKERIQEFGPEKMEAVCGINAEEIKTVARKYATADRSLIFWGMGVSQHVHGTDNVRSLIALSLITGQIGRDGTGVHPLRGQNNVQGASDAGLIPMVYPDYQPIVVADNHDRFEETWGSKLDDKPGLTVVEIMHDIHHDGIKSMYIMGENPAMSDPDINYARASLAKLEHLVVQDIFLTETAMYADVILPASAFPEKTGTFTNTNRQVQLGRQAVNPPGDARQDLRIINDIANGLGLNWDYTEAKTVFNEMKTVMKSLDTLTWERLEAEDCITYPKGKAVLFDEDFPTETGKGRLVPTDLVSPDETPDADYPFVLTTGRMLEHWHTGAMTRRSNVLDQIEATPVASIHPKELERLGAQAGDMITVSTRRGTVDICARSDRDVPPGMVFIPFCFKEAAANLLTNPVLDPYGKIPEFKTCAARVEVTHL